MMYNLLKGLLGRDKVNRYLVFESKPRVEHVHGTFEVSSMRRRMQAWLYTQNAAFD